MYVLNSMNCEAFHRVFCLFTLLLAMNSIYFKKVMTSLYDVRDCEILIRRSSTIASINYAPKIFKSRNHQGLLNNQRSD